LGMSVGLSIVLGAYSPDAGGRLGMMIGGGLSDLVAAPLAALVGLGLTCCSIWAAWMTPQRVTAWERAQEIEKPAVPLQAKADGVTTEESAALAFDGEPGAFPGAVESPYPDDVRVHGQIPDGAAALGAEETSNHVEIEEEPGSAESAESAPVGIEGPAETEPEGDDLQLEAGEGDAGTPGEDLVVSGEAAEPDSSDDADSEDELTRDQDSTAAALEESAEVDSEPEEEPEEEEDDSEYEEESELEDEEEFEEDDSDDEAELEEDEEEDDSEFEEEEEDELEEDDSESEEEEELEEDDSEFEEEEEDELEEDDSESEEEEELEEDDSEPEEEEEGELEEDDSESEEEEELEDEELEDDEEYEEELEDESGGELEEAAQLEEEEAAPDPEPDGVSEGQGDLFDMGGGDSTEAEVILEPQAKPAEATEEVLMKAADLFLDRDRVAVSLLQRQFQLDFEESCAVLDELQERGLIGPYLGGNRRDILLSREEWLERVGGAT